MTHFCNCGCDAAFLEEEVEYCCNAARVERPIIRLMTDFHRNNPALLDFFPLLSRMHESSLVEAEKERIIDFLFAFLFLVATQAYLNLK